MSRASHKLMLRYSTLFVGLLACVMCFAGIFQRGLWTPDEPREAEVGREMLLSHWSAMPTLDGDPFLEKPPLFPWAMATSYAALGVSPGSARVPAALFSIGAIFAAYLMGRRAGGRRAGVLASLVLCSTAGFALVSHSAVNDTALTCFVSMGHLAILVARDKQMTGKASIALAAAGVCAGLAFLTKGFIGPVLLLGPPLLGLLFAREWSFLRYVLPRACAWCAAFVVAIGLPWVFALAADGGWSAVRACLLDNTLGRGIASLGSEYGHARGPLYYLGAFPTDLLPWTLVLPALLASATLGKQQRAGRARYLGLLVVAGILLLSLPATKRGLYAMPLIPAAASLTGVWLSRIGSRRGGRFDRATSAIIMAIVGTALLGIAIAAGYIRLDGVLPSGVAESVVIRGARQGPILLILIGSAALALGGFMIWIAIRSRARSLRSMSIAVAGTLCAVPLLWHVLATPLIDPMRDMRRGVEQLALTLPPDEPLLGLCLDETTRAVIPFYTGRLIRNVATSPQAIEELDSGKTRHLIVMDSASARIGADLQARLHVVTAIQLNSTRGLTVYRYERRH